ncbi:MAG: PAS domain S-box protein [Bryobacteraceae bacterium]
MLKPASTVIFRSRLHFGPPVFGYTLAISLVAITGLGRLALMRDGNYNGPFILFYPAIAATSFLAGVGPGLLAITAGALFACGVFPYFPMPSSWIALSVLGPLLVTGFAHLREISERNKAVATECARFRYVSDHVSDWIFLTGESGAIQFANETACRELGFTAEELAGRAIEDLTLPSQRARLRSLLDQSRTAKAAPSEIPFERRDGTLVHADVGCSAVRTETDVVFHFAARDITERKLLEEKLREARRWESLRVLAGGIAHDFNNLLTAMMGNAALARDTLSEDHPAAGLLQNVTQAGDRSAELVRMMLATAGYGQGSVESLRVDQLLGKVIEGHRIPGHIRLNVNVGPLSFQGERQAFATLFWSLIANALESYGESPGEVTVSSWSGPAPAGHPGSFEEGEVEPGKQCLAIVVEDRGCGMAPEVLERAFDPFFTTKFTGRGLGLPAARGIVRAYSGKLWVKTRPGEGTRVEVWLPCEA